MNNMIMMTELIESRLEHVCTALNKIINITELFDTTMDEMANTLRIMRETSLDRLTSAN